MRKNGTGLIYRDPLPRADAQRAKKFDLSRFSGPRAPIMLLVVGLLLSIGLMFVPEKEIATIRSVVASVLRPGQIGVMRIRHGGNRAITWIESYVHTAGEVEAIRSDLDRMAEENRRLKAELESTRRQRNPSPNAMTDDPSVPLLTSQGVSARVLGVQARRYLATHPTLDIGLQEGIEPDAWVIDPLGAWIDQGTNRGIHPEQLTMCRGRVWGKVVEAGPKTATVRMVTDPEYRDLVRLGHSGPEGLLEGVGEPLAKVRLIEVTEPASVGDAVYSASHQGVLPTPLLYGHVVRVERLVGATHWEIWMEPALRSSEPDRVVVLQTERNPLRVAKTPRR